MPNGARVFPDYDDHKLWVFDVDYSNILMDCDGMVYRWKCVLNKLHFSFRRIFRRGHQLS